MDEQTLQLAALGIITYAQQKGQEISQQEAIQMVQQLAEQNPKQLQKFAKIGKQIAEQQGQTQTMKNGAKIQYIKRLKGLL